MASKPRWPFAFQIVQTMNAGEQLPHSLTLQNCQATGVIPTRKGSVCPPPTAGEQSGDRQRREKALPFLKEEKSEHERARTSMLAVQLCCARHCELPLSKMGNKGLFPGVAVPLAFFCTLFFRHRKKSVSAPWDGQSLSAPESARQAPLRGNCLRQSCCLMLQAGGLSARPPAPPSGSRRIHTGQGYAPAGALGAFLGVNNRRSPHCRASRLLFA